MTVRELIICLLDEPMDAEIGLQDRTEHIDSRGEKCSSYVFDIDDIEHWSKHRIFINFTDWRADRKTENSSENPNNCENESQCGECGHWEHGAGNHYYCALLEMGQECYFESKDESTLMFANTPQTEGGE